MNEAQTQTPVSNLVRANQFPALYGISKATAWTWAKDPDNDFPSPRKFGAGVTAWLRTELDEWEATREPSYTKNKD